VRFWRQASPAPARHHPLGWFLDPTPWGDSEFTTPGNQGKQQRMDLLTVLMHQLGHLLGYEHAERKTSWPKPYPPAPGVR
jgi:hypothetical protein